MVVISDTYLPVTFAVPSLTDAQFDEICEQYGAYRVEYDGSKEQVIIMPPTDDETGSSNLSISGQLWAWVSRVRRGRGTDSSTGFLLPDGSRMSPDAAWISTERRRSKPACPEFVIELMSASDRRKTVHEKMLTWMENGCLLGWMIDRRARSVTIYRPGVEPEVLTGVDSIDGEGPVDGFVLDLTTVWDPL